MGGIKNRDTKRKNAHIFTSGGGGGGTKGPAALDKRSQEEKCPYCDRVFKQSGRLKEHIQSKHAEQEGGGDGASSSHPEAPPAAASASTSDGASRGAAPRLMDVGSGGGYYDRKSPKLLLQEWCTKLKRVKARVRTMPGSEEGKFKCKVVLPDAKDSNKDIVVFLDQNWECASSEEAAHRGALAALHRLAGDRQLELLLPPQFVEQWKALGQKAAAREASQQKSAARAASARSRERRGGGSGAASWKRPTTRVVMTEERRREVESILQGLQKDALIGHTPLMVEGAEELCGELQTLGFRESQATAAVSIGGAHNLSDALHWLCLNLEEEELPRRFAPGAAGHGVRVLRGGQATGQNQSAEADEAAEAMMDDPAVQFLMQYGYPCDACLTALQACDGSQEEALKLLYQQLTGGSEPVADGSGVSEGAASWDEEKEVLEAIYGDDITFTQPSCVVLTIKGQPEDVEDADEDEDDEEEYGAQLVVHVQPGRYPEVPPHLAVSCDQLTDRQLRQVTLRLSDAARALAGEPMIHTLADTLNQLLDSPAALTDNPLLDPFSPPPPATLIPPASPQPSKTDATATTSASTAKQVHNHRRPGAPSSGRLLNIEQESRKLQRDGDAWARDVKGQAMRRSRDALPAAKYRRQVVTAVTEGRVMVVCGETGCGKSTQVPQFILEDAISQSRGGECNIIVTQPRRISALALATRVAQERGEAVGVVVGYSVRLDSKVSIRTRLQFCTTGILLRRLLSEPDLPHVSHVVIDEVHERTMESDLLLLLLRRHLVHNPSSTLRVVLMSATADANLFASYFSQVQPTQGMPRSPDGAVRVLNIPGRTFPVTDLYLEDVLESTGFSVGPKSTWAKKQSSSSSSKSSKSNKPQGDDQVEEGDGRYSSGTYRSLQHIDQERICYELMESLVCHLVEDGTGHYTSQGDESSSGRRGSAGGSILIFMPGSAEISKLVRQLQGSTQLQRICGGPKNTWVLPLHGSLPPGQQQRVFNRPPPGVTKIVVSTNVAETSITIDDCTVVIDSGRVKETGYDATRGLSSLQMTWVSKAAAQQRRGRAGRVQSGVCFRLISSKRYANLANHTPPEMLRSPLQALCLNVKAILGGDVNVAEVLQEAISPPSTDAVETALESLHALGALDSCRQLTPLGRHLSALPMDPPIAKLLLYGCLLKVVSPALTVAAAMAQGRPIFLSPPDKRAEANAAKAALLSSLAGLKSDHIAAIAAYNAWRTAAVTDGSRAASELCRQYFLSENVLEGMHASRRQYVDVLQDRGFLPPDYSLDGEFRGERSNGSSKADDSGVKQALQYSHECDNFSSNGRVVKAAISAGLYPNLLRVQAPPPKFQQVAGGTMEIPVDAVKIKFFDRLRGRVFLHPSSVCFNCGKYESGWVVFSEIVETDKVFVRDVSMVPTYSVLLFGGEISVQHEQGTIQVGGWSTFQAPARIGALILKLRQQLDALLEAKFVHPGETDEAGEKTLEAVHSLLEMDGF